MDQLMDSLGLSRVPRAAWRNVTKGGNSQDQQCTFTAKEIDRITTFYERDMKWFTTRFPHIFSEFMP
jgi:hypothetical protein